MSSSVKQFPVVLKQTETGTMHVATPETTAFDLVRNPSSAGYLSNVATVLSELADRINPILQAGSLKAFEGMDSQLNWAKHLTRSSQRPDLIQSYPVL